MHAPVQHDAAMALFSRSHNDAPPRHFGRRYDASGRFLPEPGNTIVAHVKPGSASQRAILSVRDRLMSMPEADRLAFTPVSSLHMTVFQGIIEHRRALPYWPEDMPLDTPIAEMTAHYLHKLSVFRSPGPFRVTTDHVAPTGLRLVPATSRDADTLAQWRDQLAEIFGYRHPDHETYEFHITLAYMIDWLPDERVPAWANVAADCLELLKREAPVIELNPTAYCSFEDMNHFEELLILE